MEKNRNDKFQFHCKISLSHACCRRSSIQIDRRRYFWNNPNSYRNIIAHSLVKEININTQKTFFKNG